MTKGSRKHHKKLPESRHQRDLKELGRVRLTRAERENGRQGTCEVSNRKKCEVEEKPPKCVEYTFDWAGDSKRFFVPRLEDLPPFFSDALRELVICTAKGEKTPPELKSRLMECSGDEITTAITEGIHRWHTHNCGKERE